MRTTILLALLAATSVAPSQESGTPPPQPQEKVAGGTWTEGDGTGPSQQDALAAAIEMAVGSVNGIQVARGSNLRARTSLVKTGDASVTENGVLEIGRVTQQLAGFVKQMEAPRYEKVEDGMWRARVRCLVAAYDPQTASTFVIQLAERSVGEPQQRGTGTLVWCTEDRDRETGRSTPSALKILGDSELQQRLVNTGRVKVSAAGPGVVLGENSDPAEAGKRGKALVASHRVEVEWGPIVVQTFTARQIRPGARRAQGIEGASTNATILVRNLVEGTEAVKTPVAIAVSAAMFEGIKADAEGFDRIVREVVAILRDEVVQEIYFALRPPVVLEARTAKEQAERTVLVDLPRDLAQQLAATGRTFELGSPGAFGSETWHAVASAQLLGGGASPQEAHTSLFRITADTKTDEIEIGRTRLRATIRAK